MSRSCCILRLCCRLTHCFILQTDEELDPEDVKLDEHYTIETRSKYKIQLPSSIKMRSNYGIYCFICI
jgi:hypothetical protein